VVDDVTGDPTYVTGAWQASPGTPLVIAAAAHADGLGSSVWRTDVELSNATAALVTATVELLPSGRDNTAPLARNVTVPSRGSRRLEDVLQSLFGFQGAAALRISATGALGVTSRTFNQAESGTYGQFIPGVPASVGIGPGERGILVQLRQNASFRSNVGVVSLSAQRLRVRASYFDATGGSLGVKTYTLEPFSLYQDNSAVPAPGITGGFAVLELVEGTGSFLAYASVVDRGSDDPVFIPAEVVSSSGS
jgi:hypothetical protein